MNSEGLGASGRIVTSSPTLCGRIAAAIAALATEAIDAGEAGGATAAGASVGRCKGAGAAARTGSTAGPRSVAARTGGAQALGDAGDALFGLQASSASLSPGPDRCR